MEHNFKLVAFRDADQIANHDIESSIKAEIGTFRKRVQKECGNFSGISLYDIDKSCFVEFGIFVDVDGDEFVKIR